MARTNQRIVSFLGAVVGAALTAYGVNRAMKWYRSRQQLMLPHGQAGQQRFVQTDAQRRLQQEIPDEPRGNTAWPEQRRYQPVDQPDREAIPATGAADAALIEASPAQTELDTAAFANTSGADGVLDEYVAPLIEHAIAFHSVINLLRSRQRSGEGYEGTESLTAGDRSSMRAVLDQMQEQAAYDEAALSGNALGQRAHRLTGKLREALDNQQHSGADLFRIYGEVKNELCGLTKELDATGRVTITGLDHIRQLYECG